MGRQQQGHGVGLLLEFLGDHCGAELAEMGWSPKHGTQGGLHPLQTTHGDQHGLAAVLSPSVWAVPMCWSAPLHGYPRSHSAGEAVQTQLGWICLQKSRSSCSHQHQKCESILSCSHIPNVGCLSMGCAALGLSLNELCFLHLLAQLGGAE